MSGRRRAFLDQSPGERRGVVTLEGRPERLFIEREGEGARARLGARYIGRVRALAPNRAQGFVELGEGAEALARAGIEKSLPPEGAAVEVVVVAEARADKGPVVRLIGPAEGPPRRLAGGPTLEERLAVAAPEGEIVRGEPAREVADLAEDEALASLHALGGGLSLAVEPTRALVAVDVDREEGGEASAKKRLDANLRAIRAAARLIRLKSLGGAIVIDLLGFSHHRPQILAEARAAFAPDQPGVMILPPNRLGLLEIAKPHRERPLAEALLASDGRLSARSVAQRVLRAMARQGRFDPGARFAAVVAPEVAAELRPLVAGVGPRFQVVEELGRGRLDTDIRAL